MNWTVLRIWTLAQVGLYTGPVMVKIPGTNTPFLMGSFPANPFGLHDMHGNVWEWVADDWHDTYDKAPDDGRAWINDPRGTDRVLRGGSWGHDAQDCRSATRVIFAPVIRITYIGFRLARSVTLGP
jgi:formylglycine-generating enzyme required for sulfatase activity